MTDDTSIMSLFAEFIDDDVQLKILKKIIDNEPSEAIVNDLLKKPM